MRSRLWLAAAFVLAGVWLVSDLNCSNAPPPPATESHLASASARGEVTTTPTTQPDAVASMTTPTNTVASMTTSASSVASMTPGANSVASTGTFASSVRPILLSHCAPCHEPGGVMYERLPFDQAQTIATHPAGVLKRIKDPDEKAAIEKWLAAQPKG
jgi:hypothetical protein